MDVILTPYIREAIRNVASGYEVSSLSISENYLRYKFIENLNSTNKEVIYVPTEANLPILEANRTKQ